MRLSFRTKTILGIAAIEAVMLLLLVWAGIGFMRDASENELKRLADTSTLMFATTTRNAVLAHDLATLDSATVAAMQNPGIIYARVLDRDGRVLAARGAPKLLTRPFRADAGIDTVQDGVYDAGADMRIAGVHYGRVELGLSVDNIRAALARTTRGSIAIALTELAVVALFSFLLGSYLTRQLAGLRDAAQRLHAGGLGHQVVVHGNDELAETADAFNRMSAELARADRELRERERALNEAQSIAHVGHWDWDFASHQQTWSAEARRLFSVPPGDEVSWELFLERVHPDDRLRLRSVTESALRGEQVDKVDYRVLQPDGAVTHIHSRVRLRRDAAGNAAGMHGTVQDVTERKKVEAEMVRLSSVIRQVADSIIITDRHGTIEFVNPAFETLSGFSAAEAIGQRPNLVKSGQHDRLFYDRLWSTILSGEVFRDVLTNRRKDGSLYFEEKSITPIRDEYGQITHFVSAGRDITDRIRTQERLHHLAYHDTLTGLQNRPAFREHLRQAVAQAGRRRQSLTVLFLDLDHFKEVNDAFGHAVGDGLLQVVGERLLASVRAADTVARLGGDEFAVILDGVGQRDEVGQIAAKLLAALLEPIVVDGHPLVATVSLGAAIFPECAGGESDLLKKADMAMYQAKRSGRNQLCIYSEADPTALRPAGRRGPG